MSNLELDFSQENWDVPAEIFDGVWVIAARHHPGRASGFELNNRTFIFRLRTQNGEKVLLSFGCGNAATIKAVQELEESEGVPLRWVLSNGGQHHLFLDLWYQSFPEARILIPAKRIPFTQNGRVLASKYRDRWELVEGPKPHQVVDEFGDQIDVVIFDQLLGAKELDASSGVALDHRSKPTKLSGFARLRLFSSLARDFSQPSDEVFFFHRASGLVIAGHNYQFIYTPKGHNPPAEFKMQNGGFPLNILFRFLNPPGTFKSALEGQPAPVADPKIHAEEWQAVLDWDIRAWTSCHNPPRVCGPDMSGEEIKAAVRASIARSGEDDPTGARLKWNIKNKNSD